MEFIKTYIKLGVKRKGNEMRVLLSIKMLLRSPIKTIVTWLLLIAITFMLLSRVYEYTVTSREYRNIEKTYQGVGTIEVSPPEKISISTPEFLISNHYNPNSLDGTWEDTRYEGLPKEAMEWIATLPYVSEVDTRYMTAGISDRFYRLDDRKTYYHYANIIVIEATLKSWKTFGLSDHDEITARYFNRMTIADLDQIKPLNDVAENWWKSFQPDTVINVEFLSNYRGEYPDWLDPDEIKESQEYWDYMNIAYMNNSLRTDIVSNYTEVSSDVVDELTEGKRYVLVVTHSGVNESGKISMRVAGGTASYWIDSLVMPIPEHEDDYLETDEFTNIKKLIEMTNADAHTFDVVYCGDMSGISCFANKYSEIAEGRALTAADEGSEVCVINSILAKEYGLSVGDKITLGLCDRLFEQHAGLGAVNAGVRGRYATPVRSVTLEIVGIYTDLTSAVYQGNNPHWFYSSNTIFVPSSLLPVSEKEKTVHIVKPGEFSFIIHNIRDVKPFLADYETMIEKEMGLKLTVSDGGWSVIEKDFIMMEQSSLMSITVLIIAMIVAVLLVVFLFIIRQRKEYAIMRATGCTKRRANRTLFLPLLLLNVTAVIVGGVIAWIYSTYSIMKTPIMKAAISQKADYNTSIPPIITLVCLLGIVGFLCLAQWVGLTIVGRIPPLMLLQANNQKKKRKKATIPDSGAVADLSALQSDRIAPVPTIRSYHGLSHVIAFITRNIKRMKLKSFLAMLASAILIAALGQFIMAWQSTRMLFETFPVKLIFFDGMPVASEARIRESGLVEDSYVEFVGGVAELDYHPAVLRGVPEGKGLGIQLAITNDVNRYYGQPLLIEYLPGYDEGLWKTRGTETLLVCVMFEDTMNQLGLSLGDKIEITRYAPAAVTNVFELVGRASLTNEGQEPNIVFFPSGDPHRRMFPNLRPTDYLQYSYVEFPIGDNYKIDLLRQKIKSLGITEKQYLMDTEALDKINENLKIFEVLFPIVAGILILIGGLLSGLVVLQSAKEAALLRIIGTSKLRTRIMIAGQQLVLCFIGLIVGSIIILLYNGSEVMTGGTFTGCILLFGLSYVLSTAVCSWVITRRKVLDLLQTKE